MSMNIRHFLNNEYLDTETIRKRYVGNAPFPHIVLDNFISEDLIKRVLKEFPDLSNIQSKIEFKNQKEIKYASSGFSDISESALKLISFLNSDIFLEYLSKITGIDEPLISDPYLSGGGYHEIKRGGVLKVHADFNKHPKLNLDRRLNLLLYLNEDWSDEWGGFLELYDEKNLNEPKASIKPIFNRCVIFTTTSHTFHGHPEPLNCPELRSRKSIALYYFSTGRPKTESSHKHGTLFKEAKGEKFEFKYKEFIKDFVPPIILRNISLLLNRFK